MPAHAASPSGRFSVGALQSDLTSCAERGRTAVLARHWPNTAPWRPLGSGLRVGARRSAAGTRWFSSSVWLPLAKGETTTGIPRAGPEGVGAGAGARAEAPHGRRSRRSHDRRQLADLRSASSSPGRSSCADDPRSRPGDPEQALRGPGAEADDAPPRVLIFQARITVRHGRVRPGTSIPFARGRISAGLTAGTHTVAGRQRAAAPSQQLWVIRQHPETGQRSLDLLQHSKRKDS